MELSKFAELVYNHSLAWGRKNGFRTQALSEKQLKWQQFFKNNQSYDITFHIKLIEELTGEDLSFIIETKHNQVSYVFGVVIVPKGNHNSHSYDLGKPIVCREPKQAYFISRNGQQGNLMDKTFSSVSLPTLEEVTDLLKGLRRNHKIFYNKLQSYIEDKYGKETV